MQQAVNKINQANETNYILRRMDSLTQLAGVFSAIGLITMTAIVCWEIFSRYVLNSPTYWGSEIAVYLLIAVTFTGLAMAQRSGDHVRVELLTGALSEPRRMGLEEFSNWIGLLFVLFAGWQMAAFNYQEYIHDTRNWGLLATPQWIPELFVSLGYVIFANAILVDILRWKHPTVAKTAMVIGVLILMAVVLVMLGDKPVLIGGERLDFGSLLIIGSLLLCSLIISGPIMALCIGLVVFILGFFYWAAVGWGVLAIGALAIVTLFSLLIIGVQVAISLGMVGLLGLVFLLPSPQLSLLAERSWNAVNTFTLTAVPMFVLMGALLIRSGVTRELFDALSRWLGRVPGGLGHATVGASAVFAAVSGSSLATAATMSKVACPEMIDRGYSKRLTYGVVAAGATLGILIPPSIAMIIYGTTVGVPVTQLFVAGLIPGIVLSCGFMLCVYIWSVVVPSSTPPGISYTMSEKVSGSISVFPFLVVIIAVLGSLYGGIATPSEAGGIGALSSLIICFARGMLSWRMLVEVAFETVRVTAFLLLIVVCASIMSWVFDYLRIPLTIVSVIEGANLAPWAIVLLVALIYIILGMFVESISMMLMTLPVTYPVMMAIGIDPLWFGVFLVIMIEVGLVTPPVGIILFILRGVSEDVDIKDVILGVIPFIAVILLFLVLIYFVPEIVTWLPAMME
ncbi:MAG: TRAP transporter large permease subunit [Alphaproteobacteria bacterium]|nr:TRAP transporter large permease subunit [Alphaproteobacteria bacterium]